MEEMIEVPVKNLKEFTKQFFTGLGCTEEDAEISADLLIAADRRGISSHGVQRLKRYYTYVKEGRIKPRYELKIIKETPNTLTVSGGFGMGHPVAYKVMKMVINKAKETGMCFATVRESNHFGIAGYYAMMALPYDMIGIALTNTEPIVVPTHGRTVAIGTNPISVAVPAKEERPFVLDMGTSTVVRGKVEIYARLGKEMPGTWAANEEGYPIQDPAKALENIKKRKGGGLLPLGGAEEETGGHKGYGLAVLVDILCGVLSGGAFGALVARDPKSPPNICHFLGAIRIDLFCEPEEFKKRMDEFIRMLKNTPKAKGKDRIWIHGEKEFEAEERHREKVPVYRNVLDEIKKLGKELGADISLLP